MFTTEKQKRIDASSVQNLTTSGTAAVSSPIVHADAAVTDIFVRIATTAAAYFNTVPVVGGTYTLNADGAGATAAIAATADATAVAAAIALVNGSGKVTVTGLGTVASPFIITFVGTLGHAARTLTKVSTSVVNATVTLTAVTVGDGTHDAVYSLTFTPSPVATTAIGALLPAGAVDVIRVEPGTAITVIQVTAAGIFSIAVIEP